MKTKIIPQFWSRFNKISVGINKSNDNFKLTLYKFIIIYIVGNNVMSNVFIKNINFNYLFYIKYYSVIFQYLYYFYLIKYAYFQVQS